MFVVAALCCSGAAFAQDDQLDDDDSEQSSTDQAEASAADGGGDSEDSGPSDASEPAEAVAAGAAPSWWFGLYGQAAVVPSFMLGLFLDDSPSVGIFGIGATATHRDKNGFSLVLGLGYATYGFDGPFRIKGDPEQDTEYLSSTLKLLHLRGEMLWSTDIVPDKLSFEYGIGLDLGVVLGELVRNEAYRPSPGADFAPCSGPLSPPTLSPALVPYCEPPVQLPSDAYNQDGAHYNVVEKRVPPVALIPMLPVLALRYTPMRELAVKLDFAFGLMQFTFGLSAAYGVDI